VLRVTKKEKDKERNKEGGLSVATGRVGGGGGELGLKPWTNEL
jgi:hypothetical protein